MRKSYRESEEYSDEFGDERDSEYFKELASKQFPGDVKKLLQMRAGNENMGDPEGYEDEDDIDLDD